MKACLLANAVFVLGLAATGMADEKATASPDYRTDAVLSREFHFETTQAKSTSSVTTSAQSASEEKKRDDVVLMEPFSVLENAQKRWEFEQLDQREQRYLAENFSLNSGGRIYRGQGTRFMVDTGFWYSPEASGFDLLHISF